MNKRNLVILLSLALLAFPAYFYFTQTEEVIVAGEVHYHAAFQILDENLFLIDFSGPEYMSILPCGDDEDSGDSDTPHKDPIIDLHDGVGDVLHVHNGEQKWGDLFEALRLDVKNYSGIINSESYTDFSDIEIHAYDRGLFYLRDSVIDLAMFDSVPDREYIEEVELLSGTCSS